MEIKDLVLGRYGEIPTSLRDVFGVFNNGRQMFFVGLEDAIKKRKSDPFGRYIDIGRVVFGFFEEMYNYKNGLKTPDKIKMLFGNELKETYWLDFFSEFSNRCGCYYVECKCKASKDESFLAFENLFNTNSHFGKYRHLSHHFFKKMQKNDHPFMTKNLMNFFRENELKKDFLFFPFLIIESVIHGIDDYVDVKQRVENEYINDIFCVVLGLFGLVFFILRNMRIEKKDFCSILQGNRSPIEDLMNTLFFSLVELSQVPLIEKETIKILKVDKRDEINTAKKNMKYRASGIDIFLKFSSIFLRKKKDRDFNLLIELIKDYRIMELLEKDIGDISEDLKNKDYTPVSVWWKKFKGGKDFFYLTKLLADIFCIDAETINKKIKKYPETKLIVLNSSRKKYNDIIKNI